MPRPINYCTVPNCNERVHGHGLCTKHYARRRLYGKIYLNDEEAHAKQIDRLPGNRSWNEWLAWAAGFIDGDGSINIFENSGGYFVLRLSAYQVRKQPLRILRVLFGGALRKKRRNSSKYQPTWEWKINGRYALKVLRQIEPFMVGKRKQARLAIEFQEPFKKHRGPDSYTDEERHRRLDIQTKIRKLNCRSR